MSPKFIYTYKFTLITFRYNKIYLVLNSQKKTKRNKSQKGTRRTGPNPIYKTLWFVYHVNKFICSQPEKKIKKHRRLQGNGEPKNKNGQLFHFFGGKKCLKPFIFARSCWNHSYNHQPRTKLHPVGEKKRKQTLKTFYFFLEICETKSKITVRYQDNVTFTFGSSYYKKQRVHVYSHTAQQYIHLYTRCILRTFAILHMH